MNQQTPEETGMKTTLRDQPIHGSVHYRHFYGATLPLDVALLISLACIARRLDDSLVFNSSTRYRELKRIDGVLSNQCGFCLSINSRPAPSCLAALWFY
jgi:hypothetical protein